MPKNMQAETKKAYAVLKRKKGALTAKELQALTGVPQTTAYRLLHKYKAEQLEAIAAACKEVGQDALP